VFAYSFSLFGAPFRRDEVFLEPEVIVVEFTLQINLQNKFLPNLIFLTKRTLL